MPVGAALAAGLQSMPVADGSSDEGSGVPLHVAVPPGAILMSGYWPPPKAAAAGSQSVPAAASSSAAQPVPANAAGPSRRVFTVTGCADCTRAFRGGVMLRLACGWFHTELHGPLTQHGTTAWKPCTECGGYGP